MAKSVTVKKSRKAKPVTIVNASVEQRSKWAVKAWKDPELRARLTQVLRDNAARAKLRRLAEVKQITKAQSAQLKKLEAKVGQKAA